MWEVEYDHVDKYLGVHTYMLIHRSVIASDGQSARYEFTIRLGMGHDGESCPHCAQPVTRGITLQSDGKLLHAERGFVSPHDLVKEKLAELNAFHARMDSYAELHKAKLYRGPK